MFYRISRFVSRALLTAEVGLRAGGLALAIFISFLLLAPLQGGLIRLRPRLSWVLPRLFYRTVLWLVKVRVEVSGSVPRDMPEGMAALVVTNHVSWVDIPALGALFPAAFVAKSEVGGWPILRTFARLVNTIFVDRTARASIPATNAAMLAQIATGEHVVLFPEATTYADGPQPFHSSHFAIVEALSAQERGSAIQPIAIRYSAAHAAWIGDDVLLPHVLGLMRGLPVTCELIFCEPLPRDAPLPRRAVAQACYERIAAAYRDAG
jgi:lyso-ornithine lipid O-acyltransferase